MHKGTVVNVGSTRARATAKGKFLLVGSSNNHAPPTVFGMLPATCSILRGGTSTVVVACTGSVSVVSWGLVGSCNGMLHPLSLKWSVLLVRSIDACCSIRKSRPRIASEVNGLTTTTSVTNCSAPSVKSTLAHPCTVNGAPPALTNLAIDQGCRLC